MRKMSMRAMREIADVNVTGLSAGVTYFLFPESCDKIAYASGRYGWNASLYRGRESRALYYVADYGNDGANSTGHIEGYPYIPNYDALGERERAVIRDLDGVEVVQGRNETGRAVVRYRSRGGDYFDATTTGDGYTWTICG